MSEAKDRPRNIRRAVAVAVAGVTFGVTGAFAMAAGSDDPAPIDCGSTEHDLLRAAYEARKLEALRPDLFGPASNRSDYDDLRLAAEWARRLAILRPVDGC